MILPFVIWHGHQATEAGDCRSNMGRPPGRARNAGRASAMKDGLYDRLWPISDVAARPSAVVQVSGKRTSNYFTRLVLKRVLLQYLDFFGSRHEARENSGVLTRTLIASPQREESTPPAADTATARGRSASRLAESIPWRGKVRFPLRARIATATTSSSCPSTSYFGCQLAVQSSQHRGRFVDGRDVQHSS